jgi:hypothetical protein
MKTNEETVIEIRTMIDNFIENHDHGIICLACLDGKVHISFASDNLLMSETIATCMVREARFRSIITDAVKIYMAIAMTKPNDIQMGSEEWVNKIINDLKNTNENGTT